MFAEPNVCVSAPPGVTSVSVGLELQSDALLWFATKMSQVSPAIAGNRVGSIATFTGALTLIARTYSKNGYWVREFPASSVFVIAASADRECSRHTKSKQMQRPIRCISNQT